MAAASCGEQTMPLKPASWASLARRVTCSRGSTSMPMDSSAAWSMLVRTVMPQTSGSGRPSSRQAR